MAFKWIGKSADGKTITLHRLEENLFRFPDYFNPTWASQNTDLIRTGAALDVETTGLNKDDDQIIEIGIRTFLFNRSTGEILKLQSSYNAFQDPGFPLTEEISELTGITDEMLKGQQIDWNQVNTLLKQVQIVIAHNASFDRPFVDQVSEVSKEKFWACSYKHVDWNLKGFTSPKLDLLCIYHGFFTDAHRALNDADALLHLLGHVDESTHLPYLNELLKNARRVTVNMIASNSPFESKDSLKNRNYRWDAQNRYWAKSILKDDLQSELDWLENNVYSGKFKGRYVEVQPQDAFKAEA